MKMRLTVFSAVTIFLTLMSCSLTNENPGKTPGVNESASSDNASNIRFKPGILLSFSGSPSDSRFSLSQYASPGKNQVVMGPCRVFIAVALIEAMVRIQYNDPGINIDLSEGQVFSDWAGVSSITPSYDSIFSFAKNVGLVYSSECSYMIRTNIPYCPPSMNYYYNISSAERTRLSNLIKVKVNDYRQINFNSEADLKQKLIDNGPIAIMLEPASSSAPADANFTSTYTTSHAFLLVGWDTDQSNGKTKWEFASNPWPGTTQRYYEFDNILSNISGRDGSGWIVKNVTWYDYVPPQTPVPQSYFLDARGGYPVYGGFTFTNSGTYYWEYSSWQVTDSGYYLSLSTSGGVYVYCDQYHRNFSGSFNVVKGQTCYMAIKGGSVNNIPFYCSITVHN